MRISFENRNLSRYLNFFVISFAFALLYFVLPFNVIHADYSQIAQTSGGIGGGDTCPQGYVPVNQDGHIICVYNPDSPLGGTQPCPPGYHQITNPDGTKMCWYDGDSGDPVGGTGNGGVDHPNPVDQNGNPAYSSGSCTPIVQCTAGCGFKEIVAMIKCIIQFLLFTVAVPVAIIMFVYAGFVYMTSSGDPGKTRIAKTVLLSAVGGIALMMVAWLIVNAILLGLGVHAPFNMLSS